jgi:hypothetical protein
MRATSIVASPRLDRLIGLPAIVLPVLSCIAAADQSTDWPNQSLQDKAWQERGCPDDSKGSWFRGAKFGAFIHFGVYSELGGYWQGKLYDPSEQIMGLGDPCMITAALHTLEPHLCNIGRPIKIERRKRNAQVNCKPNHRNYNETRSYLQRYEDVLLSLNRLRVEPCHWRQTLPKGSQDASEMQGLHVN